MKVTVSITGQDQRRLAERVEQLVRTRITNAQPRTEQDTQPDASPSTRRRQRLERRS